MISCSDTCPPIASAGRMQPVARFAWLTLAYNVAVIVWGAFVRATGSGAGCGNHWPLCDGDILPRAPQLQTLIEFLHRVTSVLALVVVASLLSGAGAQRRKATGRATRLSSRLSSCSTRLFLVPCSSFAITLRKTAPLLTPFYYACTLAIHFCCLLPLH